MRPGVLYEEWPPIFFFCLYHPLFISLAEVRLVLVGIFMQVAPRLQVCSGEFVALLCTLVGPLLCRRIRAQVLILAGICIGGYVIHVRVYVCAAASKHQPEKKKGGKEK